MQEPSPQALSSQVPAGTVVKVDTSGGAVRMGELDQLGRAAKSAGIGQGVHAGVVMIAGSNTQGRCGPQDLAGEILAGVAAQPMIS